MRPFRRLPEWCSLEHKVAQILTQQELHGWYFDELAAWKLASSLRSELEETNQLLRNKYPAVGRRTFTPKRNNRTTGYVEGATFTRLEELNPTSRDHIAWVLENHTTWDRKKAPKTPTGKPIIDEVVLKDIGSTEALLFLKCLDITKKLGMISEGANAWLKLCTTAKRIHHHCSVATNTHRCAHRRPNLAQTPSESEFRKLFTASPGMVMVGADLSGIELRMLANELAAYDDGRYAHILLNGDIHQVNADKIGISRKQVKTITYAFLYGAGDVKIGQSFDAQLSEDAARSQGAQIREAFVSAIDGLDKLLKNIKIQSKKGYVVAIDGRKIQLDSRHKALNYLLQSSAGVISRRWLLMANDYIQKLNLEAHQLCYVHDELQFETYPPYANDLSSSLVLSATEAGEYYNLKVRIDAEAKIGQTWADTH